MEESQWKARTYEEVLQADGVGGIVVVGDGTTDGDTAVALHAGEHEVEDVAADVV